MDFDIFVAAAATGNDNGSAHGGDDGSAAG